MKAHVVTKEKIYYEETKPFFRYDKSIPIRYEIEDELIVPPKPKPVRLFLKKKPAEKKDIFCQTLFIDRPMAMFEYKDPKIKEINDDWMAPPRL